MTDLQCCVLGVQQSDSMILFLDFSFFFFFRFFLFFLSQFFFLPYILLLSIVLCQYVGIIPGETFFFFFLS